MENRYQIITVYSDFSCKSESTNDLGAIFRAAAIYYDDPDLLSIKVYDWEKQKDIVTIDP